VVQSYSTHWKTAETLRQNASLARRCWHSYARAGRILKIKSKIFPKALEKTEKNVSSFGQVGKQKLWKGRISNNSTAMYEQLVEASEASRSSNYIFIYSTARFKW
jgi:hypothetical protein